MTIEQLLDCSPEKLKSFTDEQLLEWFKPYLIVTRPELAAKPESNSVRKTFQSTRTFDPKKLKAIEMAKQMGIELKF